jgi:hypothetical protein
MSISAGPSVQQQEEEPVPLSSVGAPARHHHLPVDEGRRRQLAWLHLHPDNDINRRFRPLLRIGAPVSGASRLVVATPPLRVLYEVHGWNHRVPRFQPWLDDIAARVPQSAVSEIDIWTYFDDSAPDDAGRNVLAAVNASVPLGPHDRPEDVWGNHVLLQESWDYLGGERDRIIARARAMARGLGLDDMTDQVRGLRPLINPALPAYPSCSDASPLPGVRGCPPPGLV